jgi:hypothetical protein
MSFPMLLVLGTAIVRLAFAVAPAIGLLNKEPRGFALRGPELEEAVELMGAVNSRLLLLSWPPLFVVAVVARAADICSNRVAPLYVLVMFAIAIAICAGIILVRSNVFRGAIPPFIVFVAVTTADVVSQLYLVDRIAGRLCA